MLKVRDTDNPRNHIEHFRGPEYAFTALVGSDDTLRRNVWGGANDAGFCVMNNVSYNLRPDSLKKKPSAGQVMKDVLGRCATVDEFEEYLRRALKPCGLEANFGVIDAAGGAAYFEVWDRGYTRYDVADSPDGCLWRTNFSLSGRKDEGRGYVRYESVRRILTGHAPARISSQWLIDHVARSFYHSMLDKDLSKGKLPGSGIVNVDDCIPRPTTTACIAFEGVGAGEPLNSTVMWCILGYPPIRAAVPVRVSDGENIPESLRSPDFHAAGLKAQLMPVSRDGGQKYVDMKTLRSKIMPAVRKTEKRTFRRFNSSRP